MSNRSKILDAIAACKGGCGVSHIEAVTGFTRKQINDNLSGLKASGKITRSEGVAGVAVFTVANAQPAQKKRGRKAGGKNKRKTPTRHPRRTTARPAQADIDPDFSAAITDDSRLVLIEDGNVQYFTPEQTQRIATIIQANFVYEAP